MIQFLVRIPHVVLLSIVFYILYTIICLCSSLVFAYLMGYFLETLIF